MVACDGVAQGLVVCARLARECVAQALPRMRCISVEACARSNGDTAAQLRNIGTRTTLETRSAPPPIDRVMGSDG